MKKTAVVAPQSLIIVYATMSLPGSILAEASLSYLGVGVNPPRRVGARWCPMEEPT
jgi:ABC-type dipeptide/oligopeptide/nickel transport system permease subunit